MLDGLYLEKENVPSAVVSTEAFTQQCQAMASAHSFDDYPFVSVFHPIATASSKNLKVEADRIAEEVFKLLLI